MCLGVVPDKHHIQLRGDEGALRWEHCLTRDGFEGAYTISYHRNAPHHTEACDLEHGWTLPTEAPRGRLQRRHYKSQDLSPAGGAAVDCRVPMLFNDDVVLSVLHPSLPDPVYFGNGDGDDLYFVLEGGGTLRTTLGDVDFEALDYVYVPKGLPHRFLPEGPQTWLNLECRGGVGPLKQFRNDFGQLRMDAPYTHRDFKRPRWTEPEDEGIRHLLVKRDGGFHGFKSRHNPLDVVGWDGTIWPWAFPILKFQARAGLTHLPPTWHGTFATPGALICSFVPRKVDWHPDAIPCPYPHSSVDIDEVLFYCKGNFTSRKGVGPGSLSHHPPGLAHGPHPGAYEGSVGHEWTDELAVMLDCAKPLRATAAAQGVEDLDYDRSFLP